MAFFATAGFKAIKHLTGNPTEAIDYPLDPMSSSANASTESDNRREHRMTIADVSVIDTMYGQINARGRIKNMKYLMSGLVVSVALATAVPAWAQTQMTPATQSTAVTGSGHHTTIHHRGVRSQNYMADRLNAEELATLQSGGPSVQRMPSGGKQLTSPNR